MKIATITDTHFGVRGDAEWMLEYQAKFFDEQFFPYLKKNKIKTIFHLGDLVDRRKFINFKTLNKMNDVFINRLEKENIKMIIIPGNHDVYFKNTNKINALDEILKNKKNIEIISEPKVITVDDVRFLFLPWINPENHREYYQFISEANADILCGHLELQGFEMYKGSVCSHGDDVSVFSKFDEVWSGHFHHPSQQKNVKYLGAPYEMTWGDYSDPRGFSVFDTKTRELKFERNENKLFIKVWYNDSDVEFEELMNFDSSVFSGKFVKVILSAKTNAYYFDKFIEKIQKENPIRLQVVEDHFNQTMLSEDDIIEEAEDTVSIMERHIDSLGIKQADKLKRMLKNLYVEASNIETIS